MKINKNFLQNLPTNRYLEKLPDFKSKRTETFTTLVLTFLAFSFFGFFAISPTLSTISQLKKQLADNQFVEKQLEEKINHLSLLQQQYTLLDSDISTVLSSIPNTPQVTLFIAQVQQITKSSEVQIFSFQTFPVEIVKKDSSVLAAQEKQDNYSSYLFSINLGGSYKNISDFLNRLTNFDRITTIDNLSFSKNSTNNNDLKLSIRGKTYFKQ